jgi:hypothetical protein
MCVCFTRVDMGLLCVCWHCGLTLCARAGLVAHLESQLRKTTENEKKELTSEKHYKLLTDVAKEELMTSFESMIQALRMFAFLLFCLCGWVWVCVGVCVCVREREEE